MKDIVKIQQPPLVPEYWDYEKSIEKVTPLIYKWKNLTCEIAAELWIAREKLRDIRNPKKINGKNFPLKLTWASYCESIGLEKRTANLWLASVFGNVRLPSPPLPKQDSSVKRGIR